MTYCTGFGLDVHARSISVCALDHLTGELAQRTFPDPVPKDVIDWAACFLVPQGRSTRVIPPGFPLRGPSTLPGLSA